MSEEEATATEELDDAEVEDFRFCNLRNSAVYHTAGDLRLAGS